MAKKIILFRHGEIEEKYNLRFIGSTDALLSEQGRQQMSKFHSFVSENKEAEFLCSPLTRAKDSFQIASEGLNIPVNYDDKLREIDFGKWENLNFMEIQENYPELYQQWTQWNPDFIYPKGESHQNLLERVKICARELKAIEKDNVIVFTHGGLIRFLICELLGMDPKYYMCFRVLRGTRTSIDVSSDLGILEEINYCPA